MRLETLLKLLSLQGTGYKDVRSDLRVVGSSARATLYPSDLDAFCTLQIDKPVDGAIRELATRMRRLARAIVAIPSLKWIELKWGGGLDTPSRWSAESVLAVTHDVFAASLDTVEPSKVKLDVAWWCAEQSRWVEVAVLYAVSAEDDEPVTWAPPAVSNMSFLEDVEEYAAEGYHFKALKRLQSLWLLDRRGTTKAERALVAAAIDGPLGAAGQLEADLRLLHQLVAAEHSLPRDSLALTISSFVNRANRNPLLPPGTLDVLLEGEVTARRLALAATRVGKVVEENAKAVFEQLKK